MMIPGISPSTLISHISTETTAATGASSPDSFGSMIKNAVESLDKSQNASAQEMAKAVTGESPDLHRTVIALQTADLDFQFALSVRNKVMTAYDDIMRMAV